MSKAEMKLVNLRIPVALYEEYKKFCSDNNSNVSSKLREHIKEDLGLNDDVKTPEEEKDFRSNISDLHGNFPAMW